MILNGTPSYALTSHTSFDVTGIQQLPRHEQSLSRRRYHVRYHVAALTQRASSTISNVNSTCVHTGFRQLYPPPPAQKFTATDIPSLRNNLITDPSHHVPTCFRPSQTELSHDPVSPNFTFHVKHIFIDFSFYRYIPVSISSCSTVTQLRNHTCPTHLILEATHPTAGEGKHRGRRHTVTGLHSCPPALLTDKHRDKTHNHGEETYRALETVTRLDSHLIFQLHTSEISSKVAVVMRTFTGTSSPT